MLIYILCSLIQSVSEIAAIVSPYGAIVDIFNNRAKYSGNGEDVVSLIYPPLSRQNLQSTYVIKRINRLVLINGCHHSSGFHRCELVVQSPWWTRCSNGIHPLWVEANTMSRRQAHIHEQLQRIGISVINCGSGDHSIYNKSSCFNCSCFCWIFGRSWNSR